MERKARQVSVALESFSDLAGDVVHTVIIPAYNEELGLPVVLEKVLALIDHTYEVLVVDDGSTDATAAVAGRYPVRLVSHRRNQGKGRAMMTGIRHARGKNVIFIDADDTYPPEGILAIATALEQCDMAVASRARGHRNIPAFNRIGNAVFRNSIRYIYGFSAYDPLTGLYGIRKKHIEKMDLTSRGFGIESEIAIKAGSMGLMVKDIPIVYRERIGEAKLNGLRDGYRIACTIAGHLPRYNPMLTFILPGLLLLLAGLAGSTFYLVDHLRQILPLVTGAGSGTQIDSSLFPGLILFPLAMLVGFQLIVYGFTTRLYATLHLNCRRGITAAWLFTGDTVKVLVRGGLALTVLSLAGGFLLAGPGGEDFLPVLPLGLAGLSAVFSGLFVQSLGGSPGGAERRRRPGGALELDSRP